MSSSLNISSATSATQWSPANNPFQQLSQALSSGNLSAAQQAYTQLQQNAPQGSQSSQGNPGQSAFAALGQALQSGNLAGAQSAFAQIQQSGRGHHHHHEGGAAASDTATTASADATGTNGTTLNVTA